MFFLLSYKKPAKCAILSKQKNEFWSFFIQMTAGQIALIHVSTAAHIITELLLYDLLSTVFMDRILYIRDLKIAGKV